MDEDLKDFKEGIVDFISFSYYRTDCSQADQKKSREKTNFGLKNPLLDATQWGWTIDPDGLRWILNEFYNQFETLYEVACKEMEKEQPRLSGNICPKCGKPLVFRKSKYGEFEACSGYPECDYVKKKEKDPLIYSDKICPKCGKPLVLRKSKKGEFYACSGFPKCTYIEGQEEKSNQELTDLVCPKCGKPLLRKQGKKGKSDFYACSGFPKCRYIQAINEKKSDE